MRPSDDDAFQLYHIYMHQVHGQRKRERPKKIWKKQVEEETEVGLKEDALN